MSSPTVQRPTLRRRSTQVVVAVIVAAMVAMWGLVLYRAVFEGREAPPDRLGDPAFATAAQARCDAALGDVAALPAATDSTSAADRADVVDEANASFAAMLVDLAALAPAGEDGEIVTEWLADWRTYLADREAYADALRADPEARLLVTAKDSQQITEFIDAFAADNRMTACATPLDV